MNCKNCGRELNPKKIVWLELCLMDGKYYFVDKNNPMPSDESQGGFPFGTDCSKKIGKTYSQSIG